MQNLRAMTQKSCMQIITKAWTKATQVCDPKCGHLFALSALMDRTCLDDDGKYKQTQAMPLKWFSS